MLAGVEGRFAVFPESVRVICSIMGIVAVVGFECGVWGGCSGSDDVVLNKFSDLSVC